MDILYPLLVPIIYIQSVSITWQVMGKEIVWDDSIFLGEY
jgi:hypothetical protein